MIHRGLMHSTSKAVMTDQITKQNECEHTVSDVNRGTDERTDASIVSVSMHRM